MNGRLLVLVLCTVLGVSLGEFPLVPDPRDSRLPRATESYRLPNDTKPLSYEIWLEPEFGGFTFEGTVEITIEVMEETDVITLHTDNMTLISYDLKRENDILEIADVTYEQIFHFRKFHLVEPVSEGDNLTLTIIYSGNLQENRRGFYRAEYEEDGDTKPFAMTQFESTSARLAFPCYDEPGIKTPFTLHITRTPPYHSIANMELDHVEEDGEKRIDHYKESVKMPTYLVAFVVSEMGSTVRKENHAVYAAPVFIDDGWADFALDTGIKVLKAMEDYTGIPFAINKMDQVAVPNNYFSAGAMENWGLVTYREAYLLYKEGISTTATRQTINTIIAHEFGHQWFGNLVSPQWWSWIWLNEGFATYFEQYAADVAIPDMRLMDQFTNLVNYPAMDTEGGGSSRPMTHDAQTPQEISSLFDRVAYEKSGAVIRMMEHMLTPPVFQRGLQIYLNAKEYDAAVAQDLWDALQAALDEQEDDILDGQRVEDIMETWNTQAGFPLVTVSRVAGKIILSQKYFLMDQLAIPPNNIWTIPISIATATDDDFQDTTANYWLKTVMEDTGIEIGDEDWLILNKQATGYFRVNYDELSWELIIDLLNSDDYNTVHLLSRNQLLEDAFNLARAGVISYNVTLGLMSYLKRETNYIPLYTFFKGFPVLNTYLMNTGEHYEILQTFVRDILQAAFNVGESNSHTEILARINILTWLCRYKHEGCLKLTHDALVAQTTASPDFQAPYYCGGLMTDENSEAKWTFLYNRYTGDAADSTEKARILTALGCSYSEEHLTRLLDVAIGKSTEYEFGSATSSFSSVYSSSQFGLDFAFNYTIENYETMAQNLPQSQISSIIGGIASRLTTEENLEQFKAFREDFADLIQDNNHNNIFNSAVSSIEANIEWSENNMEDVKKWLEEYDSSAYMFLLSLPLLIAALLSHLAA